MARSPSPDPLRSPRKNRAVVWGSVGCPAVLAVYPPDGHDEETNVRILQCVDLVGHVGGALAQGLDAIHGKKLLPVQRFDIAPLRVQPANELAIVPGAVVQSCVIATP